MIDVKSLIELANAAKARAEKATPGPWLGACSKIDRVMEMTDIRCLLLPENRDFIAAARSDVPALADAVIALAAELEAVSASRDGFEFGAPELVKSPNLPNGRPALYGLIARSGGRWASCGLLYPDLGTAKSQARLMSSCYTDIEIVTIPRREA